MKELSIEEKAKAYDEALRKAKGIIKDYKERGLKEQLFYAKEDLEYIFPELKESEDERIREQIIYAINKLNVPESEKNKLIAWLEKQGQKPILDFKAKDWYISKVDSKIHNIYHSVDKVEPKFKVGDRIIKSSKKSCPVHSSIDDTICEVAEVHDTCYILNTKEGIIQEPFEWQDHYELVKPAWSEEDDYNLQCCIAKVQFDIDNGRIGRNRQLLTWLKSLKDRYTWKPSDEQMDTLLSEVTAWTKGCPKQKILESLYNDLKKLMEK